MGGAETKNVPDPGALAWVRPSLEALWDLADECLAGWSDPVARGGDAPSAPDLDPAVAAWTVVGDDAAAQLTRSVAAAVRRLAAHPEWRIPAGVGALRQALTLLRRRGAAEAGATTETLLDAAQWIDRWLSGADQTASLVPRVAAHPIPDEISADDSQRARRRYQQGLLLWLRNPQSRDGLAEMAAAIDMMCQRSADGGFDALFWRAVAALFNALRTQRLPVDAGVKRLCGLVDRHLARLQRGETDLAAAVLPDVLARLQAIPELFHALPPEARRYVPQWGEAGVAIAGDDRAASVAEWSGAVRDAQAAWAAVCQREADGVARWRQALQRLQALAHPEQSALVRALDGATCAFPPPPDVPIIASVLEEEVAQALVLIEPWAPPGQDERALREWRATQQAVVNRLMAVAYPTDLDLAPVDEGDGTGWSGAAGRDVQAAVIDAVLEAARPLEEALPLAASGDAGACARVQESARQMAGAFAMLGATRASEVLQRVEAHVSRWGARLPSPADVQSLSEAIAAAVWYAEQLRAGTDDPSVLEAVDIPRVDEEVTIDAVDGGEAYRDADSPPHPDAPASAESLPADDVGPAVPVEAEVVPAEPESVELDGHRLPADLYAIFLDEARTRLRELADASRAVCAAPNDGAVWEPLVRVAHTLAGMARTTGITPLVDAAYALELWALRHFESLAPLTAQEADALQRVVRALHEAVDTVASGRYPAPMDDIVTMLDGLRTRPVGEAVDLCAEDRGGASRGDETIEPTPEEREVTVAADSSSEVVLDAPTTSPAPADTARPAEQATVEGLEDDVDRELLPVFLEEAQDWMLRIQSTLQQWRQSHASPEHSPALQRALHTLKGAARMVGALQLGQRIHELEADVQALGTQPPTLAWLEGLQSRVDQIHDGIEALIRPGAQPAIRANVTVSSEEATATPEVDGAVGPEAVAGSTAPVAAPVSETAPVAPSTPVAAAPSVAAPAAEESAHQTTVRLSTERLDELLNDAGEIAIARYRLESLVRRNREVVQELADHVERLRAQLREIEIQAESQMHARLARSDRQEFDPLEFDRFTRLQELTRLLAESVNDVETTRDTLLTRFDEVDDALLQQARVNRALQDGLMRARMVTLKTVEERLHRVLRRAAKETRRRAHLEVSGRDLEIDRAVLDRLIAPLEHLIRNAVAHGIEPPEVREAAGKSPYGEVRLTARREASEIVIELADDGRGIDVMAVHARAVSLGWADPDAPVDAARCFEWLFRPGFSTAEVVTELAGRGVGLDVVRSDLADIGGRVTVTTEPGRGTRFELRLPQTLGVASAVLVRAAGQTWAIPAGQVRVLREVSTAELVTLRRAGQVPVGEHAAPLAELDRYLPPAAEGEEPPRDASGRHTLLIVQSGVSQWVLAVDAIEGQIDAVLKPIGPLLARVAGVAGATVLGDGRVALILDLGRLLARPPRLHTPSDHVAGHTPGPAVAPQPPLVLIVDDSLTVRKVTSRFLIRQGYRVETAKDGVEAMERLQKDPIPAVMLLDVEMPQMDGFEVTQRVRSDPRLAALPIIMITSRIADKHREHARALGVDVYMGKPYQEDALLAHIERLAGVTHPATLSA